MATTTTHRAAIEPPQSPSPPPPTPRMHLAPVRAGQAVLDGGWWPRSTDPHAELPGLVLALGHRYGPVRQLMLNSETWDTRPRRLAVGARVIRLGWFMSVDPTLIVATIEGGDQFDLLVVPVGTAAEPARAAMARAADPTNTMHAPEIVANAVAATTVAPAGQDDDADSAWENEGGHRAEGRAPRAAEHLTGDTAGQGIRS